MIDWSLIPHSRALNSWDLLEDVKKAILEEPRRVHMGVFNIMEEDENGSVLEGFDPLLYSGVIRLPVCGTAGCISGWMNLLVATSLENIRAGDDGEEYSLEELLPSIAYEEAKDLFWGSGVYTWPDNMIPPHKQGTISYAKEVVKQITMFMHIYEKELKAHSLPRKVRK